MGPNRCLTYIWTVFNMIPLTPEPSHRKVSDRVRMSTTLCRGSGGRVKITSSLLSRNYTRLLGHKVILTPPVIHKPVLYYFEQFYGQFG